MCTRACDCGGLALLFLNESCLDKATLSRLVISLVFFPFLCSSPFRHTQWFHQFSNVTAVIFVAALSEYDQRMYEDETANRLTESIELFESTCNNPQLKDPAMIIFFNKLDLFAEKIAFTRAPMRPVFPDYPEAEEGNVEFAKEYIADQFRARNKCVHPSNLLSHAMSLYSSCLAWLL